MKNTLLALLSALFIAPSNVLLSQINTGDQIKWEAPRQYSDGKIAPFFKGASYDFSNPHLPKYCKSLVSAGTISATYTATFSNLEVIKLPKGELNAFENIELNSVPEITVSVGDFDKNPLVSVCFYPYVKREGQIYKVSNFEISIAPAPDKESSIVASAPSIRKSSSAANSVLSAGGWHKIYVTRNGIYKITPSFLADNNISNQAVTISDIRVVGNGYGMLPEINPANERPGLLDVPVRVFDQNNDGIFNGSDYVVFYAAGPHQWHYDTNDSTYQHTLNIYRDRNYYFISVLNGPGQQIQVSNPVTGTPSSLVQSFDDYDFEEVEEYNLVGTGREWFGNLFDFNLQYNSKTFSFPNRDLTSPVEVKIQSIARVSSGNTFMSATVSGQQVVQLGFQPYSSGDYAPYATTSYEEGLVNLQGNNLVVQLNYNNSGNPSGIAWLDYIQVLTRRNLIYSGQPILFRDMTAVGPGQIAQFQISGATTDMEVWDVTDHNNVIRMPTTFSNGTISFVDSATTLKNYAAFSGSGMSTPEYVAAVPSQNLRGLPPAEMLIVTHPDFLAAAKRLADFHLNNDNITSHVVTIGQVYNEFGSGGADIVAIRDFARNNYEKSKTQGVDFKYLLLFGDASYDYKDRLTNNTNYVPVYEGGSSLNLQLSWITDDFYAYLSPGEGNANSGFNGEIMDIGVGRIPCDNLQDGQDYVDKVIHYTTTNNRFGDWRNKVLLMADDVDVSWETTFVVDSEILEDIINNRSKSFNVDKIYEDSYTQISTTGSETYPEASDEMFRKIQQGNLITNYVGHGGEIGLASEKLLKLTDVNGWTNLDAMPLFVTITCEFTRLDDPKRTSAGEQLGLNPNGGAIGLISTTRTVLAGPAIELNKSVFNTVFERPNNIPKTFGEIIRDTKNNLLNSSTKIKFSLIGDPAVRLAIPFYRMKTNRINGVDITTGNIDTLRALSKVTISGQVNDFSDQKMTSFSGIASVSVYDKASNRKTLRNDGVGPALDFTHRNNLIYKGKVQVTNGDFEFTFIVPKDISYAFGDGKISLYANTSTIDAAGYMDTVKVGGLNDNPEEDNEGPVVELYMNDESFVRGGITDEDPDLFAIISDSSGINTVGSGIGHDLIAVLDENTEFSYVLNEYYEAELDSYQKGTIRYPFFDLEEGNHTLKLRVFDVHNNFAEARTEFIVASSADMALERVLNYPNPFTTYTEFQFEHNRVNQPLEVQVQIFTVSGKLVKTINELVVSNGNRVTGIAWNGLDDYGDKIGKGVYVYRLKVRAQLDNSVAEQYEKLVILR